MTEMSNDPWIQLNGTELGHLHNATGEVPVVEHFHHSGGEEEEEEISLEEDLNLEEERFLQHPYRAEDIGTYRWIYIYTYLYKDTFFPTVGRGEDV